MEQQRTGRVVQQGIGKRQRVEQQGAVKRALWVCTRREAQRRGRSAPVCLVNTVNTKTDGAVTGDSNVTTTRRLINRSDEHLN